MPRPNPLSVPIPRPLRDRNYQSEQTARIVIGSLLLVVVGILTAGRLRHAEALLHEGVRTTARVADYWWLGGRSRMAKVRFVYPTPRGPMVAIEERREWEAEALSAQGSLPMWYLPEDPSIHAFEPPTQTDVDQAAWLRWGGIGLVVLLAVGGVVGAHCRRNVEASDLRHGEAWTGSVVLTGRVPEFVYGSEKRRGKFRLGPNEASSQWPVGREIVVLQRVGHPPRVWETIESVEIDLSRLKE